MFPTRPTPGSSPTPPRDAGGAVEEAEYKLPRIIGRDSQLARLAELASAARQGRGRSVLVTGEAGIGKTTMLDAVPRAEFQTYSARGVRSASPIGFAGLHQLLLPLLSDLSGLPPRQRAALEVAFGVGEGVPADKLIVGIAALSLIEDAANRHPVLLRVDDLHWLDVPSAELLAFIAKRITGAPVLIVATSRTDSAYPDWRQDFDEVVNLQPLQEEEARSLLRSKAPQLSDNDADELIRLSSGNPLALTELPMSRVANLRSKSEPVGLAMSDRLERAFLGEVELLPASSRLALLVAAIGEDCSHREVITAGARLGLDQKDFSNAERAGLFRVDRDAFVFRHPLVAAALTEHVDRAEVSAIHLALASAVVDSSRAAVHQAEATDGLDEAVSEALDKAAVAAGRRGSLLEATQMWSKAAALSPTVQGRSHRLVRAAETARQAGDTTRSAQLAVEARVEVSDEQDAIDLARTDWLLSGTTSFAGRSAAELRDFASTVSRTRDRVDILLWAAVRCYLLQDPSPAVRRSVAMALEMEETETGSREEILREIGLTLADPTRKVSDVDRALSVFQGDTSPADGPLLNCLAFALENGAQLESADRVWTAQTLLFHRSSRPGDETIGLAGRGVLRVTKNDLDGGLLDSEQAFRLSREQEMSVVAALSAANLARVHAWKGDAEAAMDAYRTSMALSREAPFPRVLALAGWAAGMVASDQKRFDDAVEALAGTALDPAIGLWAGGELAEPAVKAGRPDAVSEWIRMATLAVETTRSSHLAMLVDRSRALLASDEQAASLFESAIASGEKSTAVLDLAKTRLFYGEWLRRSRHLVEARGFLQSALRVFLASGARSLAARAAVELRAAGGVEGRRDERGDLMSRLTGQERVVVDLAAQGMSNKEIADQIYLSHRTVQSHLRRAFDKLGVNRRSQLAAFVVDSANRLR